MKVMVTVTDIEDDWKSSTYTVEHEDPQYVAEALAEFVRRKVVGAPVEGQVPLFEDEVKS